ncbi:hypothetical protein HPT25_04535 [Bacillus sp. BRMEA1]|uniref:hypothetical protein n=1 Tax=Neobacillus endophyticus TaxID=2738405 RepID=UPI0015638BAF|nr:hypothetical protein [Neobacillus endophyticus]NRD76758.1 hypothetical protein [Neobacillus endophyticus]
MSSKVKLGIFWGAIIAGVVVVINGLRHLLGGGRGQFDGRGQSGDFAQQGWSPKGDGFGHHRFMHGAGFHHGGEFHILGFLLFLIMAAVAAVLLFRWLRRKAKSSTTKPFIDTSLMSSHTPVISQNATILDQWEKEILNKKEKE